MSIREKRETARPTPHPEKDIKEGMFGSVLDALLSIGSKTLRNVLTVVTRIF